MATDFRPEDQPLAEIKPEETHQEATPGNGKLSFFFSPISKRLAFRLANLYLSSLKPGFVVTSTSSAVAFILKLFLRVFALIFMHLLFLILINIFAKFSMLKNFFFT